MKIAFATKDMEHVNEHFGWAEIFAVYEIDTEQFRLVETLKFGEDLGDHEDKIQPKISSLLDCAIVYSANIGPVAAARLVKNKIHPVKSKGPESIMDILQRLQKVLQGAPPPWLRKAMNKR
ncbi:MAG: nitrogen fixation protein NifX [Nitrospinota bacterium]